MSPKEKKLFLAVGMADHVKLLESGHLQISHLYERDGEIAFLNKLTGEAAESLRRCITDWRNAHPYRNTKEFDDLIDLDEKVTKNENN